MKDGFYTALGTPYLPDGTLAEAGYRKEIEQQIQAGASGVLAMGTMGLLGCVPEAEYERVIRVACDAVAGRVRVLVGATDNSLTRVKARMDIINKYPVDVVVLTPPYYDRLNNDLLVDFLTKCAAMTEKDVYLYDHVGITQHKLNFAQVKKLAQIPNLKGIKSADLVLIKALHDDPEIKEDFMPIFSGSDLFGVANQYGIKNYLDGIFSCFPATIGKIQKCFDAEDYEGAKYWLKMMMDARDDMLAGGLWPMFSYAMNLLGCEGLFGHDYDPPANEKQKAATEEIMKRLGCGVWDLNYQT